jgi:hypothetical protein
VRAAAFLNTLHNGNEPGAIGMLRIDRFVQFCFSSISSGPGNRKTRPKPRVCFAMCATRFNFQVPTSCFTLAEDDMEVLLRGFDHAAIAARYGLNGRLMLARPSFSDVNDGCRVETATSDGATLKKQKRRSEPPLPFCKSRITDSMFFFSARLRLRRPPRRPRATQCAISEPPANPAGLSQ